MMLGAPVLETTLTAYGHLLHPKVRLTWDHIPICRPWPGQERCKLYMLGMMPDHLTPVRIP